MKEAYNTLSNLNDREAYDARLQQRVLTGTSPRPAQVISLEEFDDESADHMEGDSDGPWKYMCRCGGLYRIKASMMEDGEHLIACNSCSETVWVGYEVLESA